MSQEPEPSPLPTRAESAVTGRTSALVTATASSFLVPFIGSAVNVALPSIGREFGADAVLLSWTATAFLLSAAVFLVPMGRLADIHGRKRVFIVGIAIYTVAALLSSTARSMAALVAFRVVQGVGGAMLAGTGMALLTSVFQPQERGRVLGINTAAVYSGLSLGPFVGGLLTQHLGWRSVFWSNVPVGIVLVVVAGWGLRGRGADAAREKFDYPGALIYGVGLVALIYGFSRLPGRVGVILTGAGLLVLAAFAVWELRTPSPLVNMRLFRENRIFAFSNLAALINYSATFATGFLLSIYFQSLRGLGPRDAGLLLLSQPLVMAVFSPLAGRLSDRVEPRVLASTGMALSALALLVFGFLDEATPLWVILGGLGLLGLGIALFSSPNTHAVMSAVERRHYGVAAGIRATMRVTGQMFSMAVATLMLSLFVGRAQVTPAVASLFLGATRVTFGLFAVLCVAGLFASLARGNLRR